MATLTTQERAEVRAGFWEECSADRELCDLLKADGQAAVDAMDDWINANAVSFNSAIPQPARSTMTARQKVRLFRDIMRKRWGVTA